MLARGDAAGAASTLVAAAWQTHVSEADYVAVLRPLADALLASGDTRSALSVIWYLALGHSDSLVRARSLLDKVPAVDRARTHAAAGDMTAAAREMENAGLVA